MEYLTKVQAIRRKKGMVQCYVNLPLPLAAAIDLQPGEMVEWKVDNRYKLWLIRKRPKPTKRKNHRGFFSRIISGISHSIHDPIARSDVLQDPIGWDSVP